ncbi:hypothetical protein BS47DRAFT_1256280, partial [Hydnum rufescens UP504]
HIEPLAIAVNVCQGASTQANQVSLIFAKLFHHYTAMLQSNSIQHTPVRAIIESIRKCWAKVDHEPFILAVTLNPFLRCHLFLPSLSIMALCTMVKQLYACMFELELPTGLSSRFYEYVNSSGEVFGNGDWEEKSLMEISPVQVPLICQYFVILTHPQYLDSLAASQNEPLVKLALLLLSFVCNSAGTKRFFSIMGSVKTKSRSRLSISKLEKVSTVK